MIFKNKYGRCVLEPVLPYRPIKEVTTANFPWIERFLVPFEELEKIALITDNKNLQPVPLNADFKWRGYYMHHDPKNPDMVALCEVIEVNYTDSRIPAEALEEELNSNPLNF